VSTRRLRSHKQVITIDAAAVPAGKSMRDVLEQKQREQKEGPSSKQFPPETPKAKPSFPFELDWVPTALTPDTVPVEWVRLVEVYQHLRGILGDEMAADDLQRHLNAGWVESMAIRNVSSGKRPAWQQRKFPREFWHSIKLVPTIDEHGNESLLQRPKGADRIQAHASLGRGGGGYFFLRRESADSMISAACGGVKGNNEPAKPFDIPKSRWNVILVLAELDRKDRSRLASNQDTLNFVRNRLGWPTLSLRTLSTALGEYRDLKEKGIF
jgi:hypothetical protein